MKHKKPKFQKPKPPPRNHKKNDFFSSPLVCVCLIFLVVLISFFPVFKSGFLWDDDAITQNPHLKSFRGLLNFWLSPEVMQKEAHYWPLVYSLFWVQYQLWNLHPLGYHLVNLFFHILNALLLWLILSRINKKIALFSALVFAVHPVHVESVAWIIELKDLVSTCLYLCAFYFFIRFYSSKKWFFYGLSIGAFILSLLSKSMGVSLPLAFLLFLFWKNKRLSRRDIIYTMPFFLIAAIIVGADVRFAQMRENVEFPFSFPERILIASRSILFYMEKFFLPIRLVTFYPRWSIELGNPLSYLYSLVLLSLFGLVIYLYRYFKAPLFLFLFYIITLGPTLAFLDFYFMNYSFVADRFQYLASIGMIILFAVFVQFLFRSSQHSTSKVSQKQQASKNIDQLRLAFQTFIIIILSLLTFFQARHYKNNKTLFEHNIEINPSSWAAHNILGVELRNLGKKEKAALHFEKAVQLNPRFVDALNNLGISLAEQNKIQDALSCFEKALSVKPRDKNTHANLGNAYSILENYEKAEYHLKQAILIDPSSPSPYFNLGIMFMQIHEWKTAIQYLEKSLEKNPRNASAHLKMGICLTMLGKKEDARFAYEKALQIAPGWKPALKALNLLKSQNPE